MEKFKIIAKTLAGLEEILAKEIEQLGGENIAIGNRMVSYIGDKQLLYKSNLWLRTALRVLKPIEYFNAADPDELYAKVKAIDWSQYVAEGQTIAIDNTIYSENFRNSRFAIYRAKDAICDYFVEKGMKRPKVAVGSADVQLNLHISDTADSDVLGSECTLSLDSSGDPLYKRGYKEQLTDAPISEVLAAGILLKAGYDGTRDLYDPMCGSGTFLIEAALIATNTPAGLFRKGFGFQRWTVGDLAYDKDLWQDLYDDDSQEKEFLHHIYGTDISKVAIDATTENVRSAGLQKFITLSVKDFEEVDAAPWAKEDAESLAEGEQPEGGILVMNPPYGKRLFTDVPTFYKMVGNVLKKYFQGSEAWIISSDDPNATFGYTDPRGFRKEGTPFDFVGLKPSLKIELNNGGIPCQLRKYELFSGKYDEFRKDGNELDKQSADQKQDNDRYDRVRKDYGKKGGRSFDKKDGKPFKKDGKPFKKEGKDDDKKKRFFDKDGKSYERGHKPAGKDRPTRTKSSGTERTYTVNKDGSISVSRATSSERREDRKERRDEKRAPRTERPNRGNFKRGADGKFEERTGDYQPRGRRTYDPNRPMFGEDFDMSKAVLDYTKKPEDNNNENK
jgi:putative N6-adenine-specific DNA methylase